MKKMIIALDGEHFPAGAFEFASYCNSREEILLAGIFLSPVDYSRLLAYSGIDGASMMPEWITRDEDDELVFKNIRHFEERCTHAGMQFRIHKDNEQMAISSLIEETRYADVLLLSSELFYKNVQKEQPNFYLEEVLKKAECPVFLIPEDFKPPEQTILAYDGSQSSVFAIKQFGYLFPRLAEKETNLLFISRHEEKKLPGYPMITELLSGHFPSLNMQNLVQVEKRNFAAWMEKQPNSYIVLGAFSRGMVSELFRRSFASDLIHDTRMPIFISHK
jgi:hypothetical protein